MIFQEKVQINQNQQSSPQVRIYNRNVYLREAYRSMILKNHEEELKKLANFQKLDLASYRILKQKIEENISNAIRKITEITSDSETSKIEKEEESFNINEKQKQREEINYEQMCQVIFETNQFLKRAKDTLQVERLLSQIWLYLKNYNIDHQSLNVSILSIFLNLIMDPKRVKPNQIRQLMMNVEGFQRTSELKSDFIEKYPELQDQALEDIEIFKLWYSLKQQNNLFSKHCRSQTKTQEQQLSFKPTISENSRIYARKSLNKYLSSQKLPIKHSRLNSSHEEENQLREYLSNRNTHFNRISPDRLKENQPNKLSYHELLYRRKLQKQQLSQKTQEKLNFPHQNTRKATPSQVKSIVQKMYFVPKKKQDIDHKTLQQQTQLKSCTFHPTTTQYPSNKNSNVQVHGFQKEVNRLKKGRQEKLKLKQIYQNLGKPKNLTTRFTTPSFLQRDVPKLILQVNIGGGRIQKIKLHGSEDPKIVAKKFINKHNLQNSMLSVLSQLIDENLRNL